jgi:hypothetical protein
LKSWINAPISKNAQAMGNGLMISSTGANVTPKTRGQFLVALVGQAGARMGGTKPGSLGIRTPKVSPAKPTITLHRGVNTNHAQYSNATKGQANPRGGNATPAEHNANNTKSNFTSWTPDLDVATNYALRPDGDGVILTKTVPIDETVTSPSAKDVVLNQSGKLTNEKEVLLKGNISGAEVKNVTLGSTSTD